MIAYFLQDNLADELESLFAGKTLEEPSGGRSAIHVFKQNLPIPTIKDVPDEVTDEMLEEGTYAAVTVEDPYPYIIVRLDSGEIKEDGIEQTVTVNILVGVISRDYSNQGHKDVLNILQDIYERFSKNPILAGAYECSAIPSWALQEEASYPYFFGGMTMIFRTLKIFREDPYA